jgi:hypothetical protein
MLHPHSQLRTRLEVTRQLTLPIGQGCVTGQEHELLHLMLSRVFGEQGCQEVKLIRSYCQFPRWHVATGGRQTVAAHRLIQYLDGLIVLTV